MSTTTESEERLCPYGFEMQPAGNSPTGCEWFVCGCDDCRADDIAALNNEYGQ